MQRKIDELKKLAEEVGKERGDVSGLNKALRAAFLETLKENSNKTECGEVQITAFELGEVAKEIALFMAFVMVLFRSTSLDALQRDMTPAEKMELIRTFGFPISNGITAGATVDLRELGI